MVGEKSVARATLTSLALGARQVLHFAIATHVARVMSEAKALPVWEDVHTIPLGVVITSVRASSPAPVDLDAPHTRWQYLDADVLERLEAHECGTLFAVLHALVNKNAACVALEQDVLALWTAGMYEGAMHVRVMAVCENEPLQPLKKRSLSPAADEWRTILPHVFTSPSIWQAMSRDTDEIGGDVFWQADVPTWSLAEIYRQMPSPPPWENETLDLSALRCSLFAYQQNSLAKLLQRELAPFTYCDPYFVGRASPCLMPDGQRMYAFDPECMRFHHWHATALYPDVRGGILCDEMGVGKTLICLALILTTVDQVSQPEQEPMASSVTSDMAMQFPEEEYQGRDPAGTLGRIVTAPFGAPSPGERLGRRPITHIPRPEPRAPSAPIPGSISLTKIAAHRLRTTHACRPDLLESLPAQLQAMLGRGSAPFIQLWPPPPIRVSRISHERSALRVYLTSATLVLVPPTLLMQWVDEMEKHCETDALRVLTVRDMHSELPSGAQLAQDYDVVLMTHARFGKEAGDEHGMRSDLDSSPLMQVYWKRLIIDEGNLVAGDSLLVRLCAYLRVERRWIVTGTPTQALVGANAMQAKGTHALQHSVQQHWTSSERKNLDRLKHLLVRFLRLSPMCGAHASMASAAKASGLAPGKERDWNALMTTGMNSVGEWPAKRRLFDTLSRIMVRNRAEDVERDCPLPPLERRTVSLVMSHFERTTYNVLQSLIMLNAALTQEVDKDYFFHASNKKALASVMENLALACFHFAGQGFLAQAQQAHDLIAQQLDKPNGVAERYRDQAASAMHQLAMALRDTAWCEHIRQGDVLYTAEHPSQHMLKAWSKHGLSALTSDELLWLRDACRKEAAHVLDAEDLCEELVTRGAQYVHRQTGRSVAFRSPKQKSVPKRMERLDEHSEPPPPLPPGFANVHLHTSTSTKLNNILAEVLAAVHDEKVLIFSTLDNVLYELANALELAHVPFLFYVSGMPQHSRNTYASAFMHKEQFRCMLMSTSVGGRGLDLHHASRVILAEPIWQWDLESQVVKRAWRMGQTRRVLISTYVMQDTFEAQLMERKHERMMQGDADSELARTLTDDPGMRAFVAHPRMVPAAEPKTCASWNVLLFDTPTNETPSKRTKLD